MPGSLNSPVNSTSHLDAEDLGTDSSTTVVIDSRRNSQKSLKSPPQDNSENPCNLTKNNTGSQPVSPCFFDTSSDHPIDFGVINESKNSKERSNNHDQTLQNTPNFSEIVEQGHGNGIANNNLVRSEGRTLAKTNSKVTSLKKRKSYTNFEETHHKFTHPSCNIHIQNNHNINRHFIYGNESSTCSIPANLRFPTDVDKATKQQTLSSDLGENLSARNDGITQSDHVLRRRQSQRSIESDPGYHNALTNSPTYYYSDAEPTKSSGHPNADGPQSLMALNPMCTIDEKSRTLQDYSIHKDEEDSTASKNGRSSTLTTSVTVTNGLIAANTNTNHDGNKKKGTQLKQFRQGKRPAPDVPAVRFTTRPPPFKHGPPVHGLVAGGDDGTRTASVSNTSMLEGLTDRQVQTPSPACSILLNGLKEDTTDIPVSSIPTGMNRIMSDSFINTPNIMTDASYNNDNAVRSEPHYLPNNYITTTNIDSDGAPNRPPRSPRPPVPPLPLLQNLLPSSSGCGTTFETLLPTISVATRTLLNTSGLVVGNKDSSPNLLAAGAPNGAFGGNLLSSAATTPTSALSYLSSLSNISSGNNSSAVFTPSQVPALVAGPGQLTQPNLLLSTGDKKYRKTFWDVLAPSYKSKNEDFKKLFMIPAGDSGSIHPLTATADDLALSINGSIGTINSNNLNNNNNVIESNERLLVDYSCALQKEILIQGRMYVSQSWLCFYANIFKWESKIKIRFKDIVSINKEKLAKIIPNALTILTRDGLKYTFASFTSRDKSYLMLFKVWQNALMDQVPLPPGEIWQLVHESYGNELGLTSDDEDDYKDYTDPPVFGKVCSRADINGGQLLYQPPMIKSRTTPLLIPIIIPQAVEAASAFEDNNVDGMSDAAISMLASPASEDGSISNGKQAQHRFGKVKSSPLLTKKPFSPLPPPPIQSPSDVIISPKISTLSSEKPPIVKKESSANSSANFGTTEDELGDNEGGANAQVSCLCTHHAGKLYLDLIINKTCDEVFQLLFTNSKFFRNIQKERNTKSLVMSEWKRSSEVNGHVQHHNHNHSRSNLHSSHQSDSHSQNLKKRVLSYVVEISSPLGTKSAPTTEKQTLIIGGESKKSRKNRSKKRYVVECEVTNSGVPYSDAYYVICRYCLTRVGPPDSKSCRLTVHCLIGYKKSVFSLVKNIIQKNCQSGLQEYFKFLGDKLIQELRAKSITQENLVETNCDGSEVQEDTVENEPDSRNAFKTSETAGDSELNLTPTKKLLKHSRKSSVSFSTIPTHSSIISGNEPRTHSEIPSSKTRFSIFRSGQRESSASKLDGKRATRSKGSVSFFYLIIFFLLIYTVYLHYQLSILQSHIFPKLYSNSHNNGSTSHNDSLSNINDSFNVSPSQHVNTTKSKFSTITKMPFKYWITQSIQTFAVNIVRVPVILFTNFQNLFLRWKTVHPSTLLQGISNDDVVRGVELFGQLLKQMEESIMALKKEFNNTRIGR